MMSVTFEDAPALPAFLEKELPWPRRAVRVRGKLIHFIDVGEGRPVVLFHGNPTWCYLWRKVIRRVAPEVRVIAPDLVGLGLSDKPLRAGSHSLSMHIDTMNAFVDALELDDVTIAGQDWGGPIGAGVARRNPDRVRALVFGNTAVIKPRRPLRSKAFHKFAHFPIVSDLAFRGAAFPMPMLDRAQGDRESIGWKEKAAYLWPLKSPLDRAAPMALARMVPNSESHPSTALLDDIGEWIEAYRGPAELVWGTRDPILGRGLRRHRAALPQARVTVTDAGHFLQEEVPDALAQAIFRLTR